MPSGTEHITKQLERNTALDEVGRLVARKSALLTEVRDAEQYAQKLRVEVGALHDRMAQATAASLAEHAAHQERMGTLLKDLGALTVEHETTTKAVTKAKGLLMQLQADAVQYVDAIAIGRQAVADLADKQVAFDRLQAMIAKQQRVLDETTQGLTAAKARQQGLQEEHDAMCAQIAEATSTLAALTTSVAAKVGQQSEFARVEAQIQAAEAKVQAEATELGARESALATERAMVENTRIRQAQERQLLDALGEDASKTRQDLARALREHEGWLRDHQQAEAVLQAAQGDLAHRAVAIDEAEKLLVAKGAALEQREETLRETSLAMAAASARLRRLVVQQGLTDQVIVPDVPGKG